MVKKNLINVPLTLKDSIPHVVNASYGACSLMLRPASLGTGVIAGGSVRTVLELAGIKNILAKQFGSNNILNNAKATILALTNLNEKVELGKYQSSRKQLFYDKVMKNIKMLESLANRFNTKAIFQNNPTKKLILTLIVLLIFRFCNTIPLAGVDQDALRNLFFN